MYGAIVAVVIFSVLVILGLIYFISWHLKFRFDSPDTINRFLFNPDVRVQLNQFAENLFDTEVVTYCINLDRSKDRLITMERKCTEQKLDFARWPAVDGHAIDMDDHAEFLKHLRPHFVDMPERKGHMGCFLSHLTLLQSFLDNTEKPYCLVLEDDCSFGGLNFRAEVSDVVENHLPEDWDILLCGYHIDQEWDGRHRDGNAGVVQKGRLLHNIIYFAGTHCYLINRRSAKLLLDNLKQPHWYIDWEISRLAKAGMLQIYGIFPPLVCQPAAFRVHVNDIRYQYSCDYVGPSLTNAY